MHLWPACLEVIKLEYSLRLKIKRNDWLLVDFCLRMNSIFVTSRPGDILGGRYWCVCKIFCMFWLQPIWPVWQEKRLLQYHILLVMAHGN